MRYILELLQNLLIVIDHRLIVIRIPILILLIIVIFIEQIRKFLRLLLILLLLRLFFLFHVYCFLQIIFLLVLVPATSLSVCTENSVPFTVIRIYRFCLLENALLIVIIALEILPELVYRGM